MATIEQVTASVAALTAGLVEVKGKLDVIQALVAGLESGQVATQEQVDALASAVNDAQVIASAISTEEDEIK